MTTNLHDKMLAAIDAYFSASDGTEEEVAENLLLDVRDEINKQKYVPETNFGNMAEPKIGCVNHDCDQCKAREQDNFCDKNCVWTDHHPDCKAVQEGRDWSLLEATQESLREHMAEIKRLKANLALYKMAEDAVTIGLSYNDWPKIGCVNHDCDQCKAVQEPMAWRNAALRVGEDLCSVGPFGYYDMTAEQWLDWALGVVTVHAPPAAPVQEAIVPKPWVNLTIDELLDLEGKYRSHEDLSAAIKAKLKEKNT